MANDIIPIILGLSSMIIIGAIIALTMFLNYRKRVLNSQEVMAAIEKGIEVPFAERESKVDYRSRGILWTSMGLAAVLVFWAISGEVAAASVGLIPTAFGISSLLIAWSNNRDTDKS